MKKMKKGKKYKIHLSSYLSCKQICTKENGAVCVCVCVRAVPPCLSITLSIRLGHNQFHSIENARHSLNRRVAIQLITGIFFQFISICSARCPRTTFFASSLFSIPFHNLRLLLISHPFFFFVAQSARAFMPIVIYFIFAGKFKWILFTFFALFRIRCAKCWTKKPAKKNKEFH